MEAIKINKAEIMVVGINKDKRKRINKDLNK
jgi:hypothetical protein